ncbi:Protein CBG23986 [Caenorhabditis briggsae]|uniref:Protein CBG23986 n=1 Tax=Caenorhabditis briggsae TaxID=6238 RepID=A8WJQ7_CAEBR|nr:Protein CBG23986 [Caenorhabditis briggsae]CAP20700.1 Protein CBG23986 [Caenorhabditis briggsae]
MNVSFCLQKNRENNRKTKVKSKKPKFRKTLEEALLLYFQKGIRKSSFSCMSTGHSGKMQLRMRMEKVLEHYFETTINIIFCSSSSTEAKMVKTRSSDAVSATAASFQIRNNICQLLLSRQANGRRFARDRANIGRLRWRVRDWSVNGLRQACSDVPMATFREQFFTYYRRCANHLCLWNRHERNSLFLIPSSGF